jgi:hypothetical protein
MGHMQMRGVVLAILSFMLLHHLLLTPVVAQNHTSEVLPRSCTYKAAV